MKNLVLPDPVLKVLERLNQAGYKAYVVGGSLRDLLSGKEPKDYDVATSARPEQVMELFERSYPIGVKHGTVLVFEDDMPVEITTFRKESDYTDHRRPEKIVFVDDIEEDLKRRDFTINAMAYHPDEGLIDPYQGLKDLDDKVVRSVGKANERFEEDALRMLRAYRFAGMDGFRLDPETEAAIEAHKEDLKLIASERIADEIEKILESNPQQLDKMTSLLKDVFPELEVMVECEQNNIHHYTDVLHHTLDALDYLKDHDYTKKRGWALLLHDVGKPASKTTNATGDHFTMHPQISSKMARDILKRFHLSNEMRKDIPLLILLHDAFYKPSLKNLYKLQVQYGMSDELIHDLFAIQKADIDAHTKHDRLPGLEEFIEFYEKEKDLHPKTPAELEVDGNDIKEILHLEGKELGDYLKALHQQVFFNKELEPREVLLEYVKSHPDLHTRAQKETKKRKTRIKRK